MALQGTASNSSNSNYMVFLKCLSMINIHSPCNLLKDLTILTQSSCARHCAKVLCICIFTFHPCIFLRNVLLFLFFYKETNSALSLYYTVSQNIMIYLNSGAQNDSNINRSFFTTYFFRFYKYKLLMGFKDIPPQNIALWYIDF